MLKGLLHEGKLVLRGGGMEVQNSGLGSSYIPGWPEQSEHVGLIEHLLCVA